MMKYIIAIFAIFLFHLCAAQQDESFRLHKVGHIDSPHKYGGERGVALKLVEPDGSEHVFFDPVKDIFAPPEQAFSICDTMTKRCCNLESMYPHKEESISLSLLKRQYQHGIDRWVLYYHLCIGPQKNIVLDDDVVVLHKNIDKTMSSYADMRPFLVWFKTSSITK